MLPTTEPPRAASAAATAATAAAAAAAATSQDDPPAPLDGYARLAASMSAHPSMCILRRFGKLRALNLLRLQAELHDLEQQLADVWQEDKNSGGGDDVRPRYVRDFWLMRDEQQRGGDDKQLELLGAIARVLAEYDAALDAARKLARMPAPSRSEVGFLRDWLVRPGQGDNFLCGGETTIWAADDGDLLTLMPERADHTDRFSNFLHGRLLDVYHRLVTGRWRWRWRGGKKEEEDGGIGRMSGMSGIVEYSDDGLRAVSNGVAAAMSAVIPMAMVLGLYYAKRIEVRLGLLFVFTTVFAVALSVFTGARKAEVFGAVAAFAAVEVVFVGSVLG